MVQNGDLGHYDADGYLKITGRAKKCSLSAAVMPIQRRSSVISRPIRKSDKPWSTAHPTSGSAKYVSRLLCAKEGKRVEAGEIVDFCRGQVADYKVPRHVEIVDDFPRTSTTKSNATSYKDVADRFSV